MFQLVDSSNAFRRHDCWGIVVMAGDHCVANSINGHLYVKLQLSCTTSASKKVKNPCHRDMKMMLKKGTPP